MGGRKHDAWHDVRLRSPAPPIASDICKQLKMSFFVHIVDDDKAVREALGDLLRSMDYHVALYESAADFLRVELPAAEPLGSKTKHATVPVLWHSQPYA